MFAAVKLRTGYVEVSKLHSFFKSISLLLQLVFKMWTPVIFALMRARSMVENV